MIKKRSSPEEGLSAKAHMYWTGEIQENSKSFRQMTKKRFHREQELHQFNNLLTNVINSLSSILITVDNKMRVQLWNRKAIFFFQKNREQAGKQMLNECISPFYIETDKIKSAIHRKQIQTIKNYPYEKDNKCLLFDVVISPLSSGSAKGAIIRIDDVTTKTLVEETMVQAEKIMSMGVLAAGMAHEINNPLSGMMLTANVINNRMTDTQMQANTCVAEEIGISMYAIKSFMEKRGIMGMLKTINELGCRMAENVNNMLSFARKSEGDSSFHTFEEILENTLELAATDFDSKNHYDFKKIKIKKVYEDIPPVSCEKTKIQQVLLNILLNGAQAMQEAEIKNPQFIIRTRFEKNRKTVCMEIEDNGPGMDEETRKQVFEPFFTTKPLGIGTGLGLSVSYFIITKNHGGKMSVASSPGKGAIFYIRLPFEAKN